MIIKRACIFVSRNCVRQPLGDPRNKRYESKGENIKTEEKRMNKIMLEDSLLVNELGKYMEDLYNLCKIFGV